MCVCVCALHTQSRKMCNIKKRLNVVSQSVIIYTLRYCSSNLSVGSDAAARVRVLA